MKDTTGRPLAVGDTVAFIKAGRFSIGVGKVLKLTPKGATVIYGKDHKLPRVSSELCFINNEQ